MSARVLIAHGNTQRLKRAVSELQARGFEVAATPDGGDAFARFFEESPDLVVCSEALPGLSGVNFARMVRSQSPTTPVVILVDGEFGPDTLEFDARPDPLDVETLCAAYPDLVPATPTLTAPAAKTSSTVEVFTLSALKRFQRGSHPLALLDDAGINAMARVADKRACTDGDLIIRQGDVGDSFYFIVEGQVRVTLRDQGDAEVARIGEGGFFGEMALLSDQPRSASVWAVGAPTLLRFDRDKFLPILESYPSLREMLSGVAIERSEENLWSVLLADDEVQESLAGLGDEDDEGEQAKQADQNDFGNQADRGDRGDQADQNESGDQDEVTLSSADLGETKPPDARPAPAVDATPTETAAVGSPLWNVVLPAHDEVVDSAPAVAAPVVDLPGSPLSPQPSLEQPRAPGGFGALLQAPRQALLFAGAAGLVIGVLMTVILVLALGGESKTTSSPASSSPVPVANLPVVQVPPPPSSPPSSAVPPAAAPPPSEVPAPQAPPEEPVAAAPTASPTATPAVVPAAAVIVVTAKPAKPATPVTASAAAPAVGSPPMTDAERRDLRKQFFVRYRARDFAAAVELGRRLQPAAPNDWEVAINVADSERSLGKLDEALASFLGFMTKFPTNVYVDDAAYWAADIYLTMGKKSEAKPLLQKVVANPKSRNRANAESKLKKL